MIPSLRLCCGSVASSTTAKITTKEEATDNGEISLSFSIGPNEKDAIDFAERPILKKYFDEAIKIGFNIARLPRIGGLVNPVVDAVRYRQDEALQSAYLEKVFEVCRKIEDAGAGMTQIEEIGKQYGNPIWMKGLKNAPESERNKIAKAAAEWADGDSVAISIGYDASKQSSGNDPRFALSGSRNYGAAEIGRALSIHV